MPTLAPPFRVLALPLFSLALATGCRQAAPPSDASLASSVQARLAGDSAIASEPIQTSAQNGIVTLNGAVSSDAARALAANDAAQVPGTKTVVNNLTVQTAVAPPPVIAPSPAPSVAPPVVPPTPPRRAARVLKPRATPAPVVRETRPPAPQEAESATPPPPRSVPTPSPAASVAIPAPPAVRSVTVPAGTILPVRMTQTLDSATTQQGQSFSGSLASDVAIDGLTVLRQGAAVTGSVTAVQEAGHFKGNSLLSIQLTGLTRRGDQLALSTDPYSTEGKGRGKNTALKTGGGAAVGAILGGIFGGGKGAAIGAGAGGGLGAGANAITRGEQVQIPAESLIRFRLATPITVRVTAPDAAAAPATPQSPDSGRRPLN